MKLLKMGGTIVSEYIIGVKAEKYHFPIRNRIVSGLANKILVVEAEEKSGTLITVRTCFRARKRCVRSTTEVQFIQIQKVQIY